MTQTEVSPDNIQEYLKQHQEKELLRFVAVGSVDDGKSTLIGRLLHDTKGVYEDQLSAVKKASIQGDMEIDFSLFTDGLKAEREQGITIDVAYRYFSTDRRKFIIADTPGHVQYTRNMATGASTANVGIILIDARLGVLQQSRRHAYIASLLGIPHLAVAVNKMDLKGYDQSIYDAIVAEFSAFARKLDFKDVKFIPISAKLGDNVVHKSANTPWHDGGSLLEYLERVPIAHDRNESDFRFPVQFVVRPDLTYRGFAGEVSAGSIRRGDEVMALPSGKRSKVASIDVFEGAIEQANVAEAVTLRLEDEIDVSRGDMLVHPSNQPEISQRLDAHLVWMSEKALDPEKSYLLKHTTQLVRVNIEEVTSVTDLDTLESHQTESLKLNDIGQVRLFTHRPLFFDAYRRSRRTGAFVLIDSISNNTVAAGMIQAAAQSRSHAPGEKESDRSSLSQVSPTERTDRLAQIGAVLLLSGEHVSKTAFALERALYDQRAVAAVVDALDEVSQGIGVPPREPVQVAARLCQVGVIAILSIEPTANEKRALAGLLGKPRVLSITAGENESESVLSALAELRERGFIQ